MTNCPNCDGLLSYEGGLHCDYCGARFEKPERDDAETVFYDWTGTPVLSMTRGLLTVNEARAGLDDWPSPENLVTR